MPAKSKRQFNFMKGVESGSIKAKGLDRSEAEEFTKGQSPKTLPFKKKKRKRKVRYPEPK